MKLQPALRFLLLIFVGSMISFYLYNRANQSGQNQIVIYAHSSFISKYGPGPLLARKFNEQTGLAVKYINVGEAGLLLNKINSNSDAVDLVIGLDNFALDQARADIRWKPIGALKSNFIMYDWSPVTFIYKDSKYKNIKSFFDIQKNKDLKITIPDPRFSTTGLVFLYWVYALYGEDGFKKALEDLKPNVHSFPSSWSSSYGVFKQGKEAQMSLSYVTSPVYHWAEEKNGAYQALSFTQHVSHKEYLGVPERCHRCDEAQEFIDLMLSNEGQHILMTKNYMLPVDSRLLVGTEFMNLPQLNMADAKLEKLFISKKEELIDVWKNVFK